MGACPLVSTQQDGLGPACLSQNQPAVPIGAGGFIALLPMSLGAAGGAGFLLSDSVLRAELS